MKISKFISQLEAVLDEHGDLSVQLYSYGYQDSNIPPSAMGGGGGGYSTKWHGTVGEIQVSKEYPDQLEIHGTT